MPATTTAHPPIVTREQWRIARKELLEKEKELTRARDALSAARRRLPMVRIDKDYRFAGPVGKNGNASLLDLFEGRRQLIVYHFMFDPADPPAGKAGAPWTEGCPGCSHLADNMPHPAHLHARDTTLAMVSRAPLSKIAPFHARMGWRVPWYSSFESDFNYDFHVTMDAARGCTEWNYRDIADLAGADELADGVGELPGLSVFLRVGNEVYHTYSTYARGLDALLATYQYLDLTPFGRQEEWEDSPPGWPRTPTHGWLRHHDRYDERRGDPGPCCEAGRGGG